MRLTFGLGSTLYIVYFVNNDFSDNRQGEFHQHCLYQIMIGFQNNFARIIHNDAHFIEVQVK